MTTYAISTLQLPWSVADDDDRFIKILRVGLIIFFLFALPVTFIKMPELTRAEKSQLPPQLARVLLEKQEIPKPIEPPKVEEKKPEEKKPEEKKPEEKKPIEKPAEKTPIKESEKPIKDDAKTKQVTAAREKAQAVMSTFKDDLMEMRETLDSSKVETATTTVTNSGGVATQVDRSMITSGVTKGSGGINAAAYSRDTGGVALSGRATTHVKSGLGESTKKAAGATGAGGGNSDGGGGAARSEEEIRKVMEQHKGAIFSIYNRALRENAALQGKVVVKIVIDPSGHIVDASIVSSELKDPDLEAKLLQRIRLISFPSSNVALTTLNYSFDFLPQ